MPRILVVEDSPDQARMIAAILEAEEWDVPLAANGREAVDLLARTVPDVIVTDMRMPEMNGLELTEHVAKNYPRVPVVLITAFGSEELAEKALRKGAASYIPKRRLAEELAHTVTQILELIETRQERAGVLNYLKQSEHLFVLENDPGIITPIVRYIEGLLEARFGDCDDTCMFHTSMSLNEALTNAMHHGNLEVDSELKEQDPRAYEDMVARRMRESPYRERRVHFTTQLRGEEVTFSIRDEGPGFDIESLPNPTDPANLLKLSGRGLYLITTFMDRVEHNEQGNVITMGKRVQGGNGSS